MIVKYNNEYHAVWRRLKANCIPGDFKNYVVSCNLVGLYGLNKPIVSPKAIVRQSNKNRDVPKLTDASEGTVPSF